MNKSRAAFPRQRLLALATAVLACTVLVRMWCLALGSHASTLGAPAVGSDANRLLFVMHGHNASATFLTAFQQLQRDLGSDRTFVVFDDTRGAWPFGDAMRMTQPRSAGSPNVLLFNRSEAMDVLGNVTKETQVWLLAGALRMCCAARSTASMACAGGASTLAAIHDPPASLPLASVLGPAADGAVLPPRQPTLAV